MLVLSFILIALGKAIPKLSPEVCDLLLETGIDNMATLIEELGIKTKAIYLSSSLASNRPRAFIPLHSNGSRPEITKALPQRLIARYGANPEDIGLLMEVKGYVKSNSDGIAGRGSEEIGCLSRRRDGYLFSCD